MLIVDRVKDLYSRHTRALPILFFLGGFLWDALTLKRIDSWVDHLFMASYLFGLGGSIWLILSKPKPRNPQLKTLVGFAPLFLQFFLGGLFSAYVVFFFKSVSLWSTYVYVALLLVFLLGNEWINHKRTSTTMSSVVFTLAIFSYLCFTIPVLTRTISNWSFILTVGLTASLSFLFWWWIERSGHIDLMSFAKSVAAICCTLLLVSFAYFGNYIPPVPISLKTGGIYLNAERADNDRFRLVFEEESWRFPWQEYNKSISYNVGDTLYCFAAVFAPIKLETALIHKWQRKIPNSDQWETTDELDYRIVGGRDGGFRGITFKRNISPGEWRVDIMTETEKTIGRLPFYVVEQELNKANLKTVFN